MQLHLRQAALAAALVAAATATFAQRSTPSGTAAQKGDVAAEGTKEALHERMSTLAQDIESLRSRPGTERRVAELRAEYQSISATLGGDEPVRIGHGTPAQLPPSPVIPTPCNGPAPTTTNFAGTNGPITPPNAFQGITFTAVVSGAGPYLWDLDLNTNITHTASADLDITLQSPAGTIVVITTDNGGTFDNNFAGTTWNDNVNDTATDHVYANLVTATPLSPEGRLSAFRGENPNGTWTLRILDDATTNTGTLNSWSLDVSTLAGAPVTTTTSFTSSPGLAVGPAISTVSDGITVSGLATNIAKVTLNVNVPHTFASDLDITLTSPTGTVVTVTTDNGAGNDNVYAGTVFDPSSTDTVTDHVYTNLVVATPLSPEGSFDNFLGQDPNGTWTLTVGDDAGGDGGTLVSWGLDISTSAAPSPSAPANFAGATGAIPDFSSTVTLIPTVYTNTVVGAGPSLWDVDLSTFITHTSSGDIDMTLTSPAGTVVTITTDNGGTFDDNFNGTLWDDNANDPVTEHVFANAVTATPLSPEGRLAAFRGENPNGVWTLTITDDAAGDNGTLNSWSLDVSSLAAAPLSNSTTFSSMPGTLVGPAISSITDTITTSGLNTSTTKVTLFLDLPHTFAGDLDITLTSPAGTVVVVTTDNGAGNDNVFSGTLFDPSSTDTVTDHTYTNLVTATPLSPEGSFDNFLGQDPNGTWTLTVADDAGGDGGTLVRWDLTISACRYVPSGFTSSCFGDGTAGAACPCTPGASGRGCPNSAHSTGALLAGSGTASVSADTAVLSGSDMTPNSPVLYFQGTTPIAAVFGDGLRCVAGNVIRLGPKTNDASGSSSYPSGSQPISIKGMINPGDTRSYQAWYRDAFPGFCTTATFNLTNSVQVTWGS